MEQASWAIVLLLIISYIYVYYFVNRSKQYFIVNKRLQIMMTEQRKIVKNLPDGVLICKQVVSRAETVANDFSQMVLPEPTLNQVKFYNKTFQALFGLDIDFEHAKQIQNPLIINSTN